MKGEEFAEIRDVIVSSFNPDEFDMFLYERLEFDRPLEVPDGPFRLLVGNVVRQFEREGRTAALIAAVAAVRPRRPEVQQVYAKYARALIKATRQAPITEAMATEYDRLGLNPPVDVYQGGSEAVRVNSGRLERIVKPLLQAIDPAQWREVFVAQEGRVCRVEVNDTPVGTGFLVGPDAVLTNYHVLEDVIRGNFLPEKVRLRFDYKRLADLQVSAGNEIGLAAADWLIDHSPYTAAERAGNPDATLPTEDELDHALVRLDRPIGNEPIPPAGPTGRPRGWIHVPDTEPPLYPRMPLLILQHPRAALVKLALDTEGVLRVNANRTRVRYATNTEEGSSGSPCFDMDWLLVALHHYGDPAYNKPRFNQGIPIGTIRARLRRVNKVAALGGPSPG